MEIDPSTPNEVPALESFINLSEDTQMCVFYFLSIPNFVSLSLLNKSYYRLVHSHMFHFALENKLIYKSQKIISGLCDFYTNEKGHFVVQKLKGMPIELQETLQGIGLLLLQQHHKYLWARNQFISNRYWKSYEWLNELIVAGNFRAAKFFCKFIFLKHPILREKQINNPAIGVLFDMVHEVIDANTDTPNLTALQQCYHTYYHVIIEVLRRGLLKLNSSRYNHIVPEQVYSALSFQDVQYNFPSHYKWIKAHLELFQMLNVAVPDKEKLAKMESIYATHPIKVLGNSLGWEHYSPTNPNQIEKNFEKAFFYCSRKEQRKHGLSVNNLGVLYRTGSGVKQDYTKAMELYQLAAEIGASYGAVNLGYMYESDPLDLNKAYFYFKVAAKCYHEDALFKVGYYHQMGKGPAQVNYKLAARYYMKAAQKEYSSALNNIGMMYENGQGLKQNLHLAFAYYKTAAAKDSAAAYNNLGLMYMYGRGIIDKNFAEAEKCFKQAIQRGFENSKNHLRTLHNMMGKKENETTNGTGSAPTDQQ